MNRIELVLGNIVKEEVDAIVNAANAALIPGGGVDGAIHDAAGPELYAEAKKHGGCPTGSARLTKAYGRLKAKWVIHAVGPRYEGKPANAGQLASAYRESLRLAAQVGAKTVAFPSISTGIYGYPLDEAAPIAIGAVAECLAEPEKAGIAVVRFVLFDPRTFSAYETAKKTAFGGRSEE